MGLFNGELDPKCKYVEDYDQLNLLLSALRTVMDRKVVATIGTWDMLHIGHLRYLQAASTHGDILVVGADTDEVVKKYKGEFRPVVPFSERVEMLTYQSCVDIVTAIPDVDGSGAWTYGLLAAIKPDVFVAVEDSYPPQQRKEIEQYVGELVVLPRQAENTSTSYLVQRVIKGHLAQISQLGDGNGK